MTFNALKLQKDSNNARICHCYTPCVIPVVSIDVLLLLEVRHA